MKKTVRVPTTWADQVKESQFKSNTVSYDALNKNYGRSYVPEVNKKFLLHNVHECMISYYATKLTFSVPENSTTKFVRNCTQEALILQFAVHLMKHKFAYMVVIEHSREPVIDGGYPGITPCGYMTSGDAFLLECDRSLAT